MGLIIVQSFVIILSILLRSKKRRVSSAWLEKTQYAVHTRQTVISEDEFAVREERQRVVLPSLFSSLVQLVHTTQRLCRNSNCTNTFAARTLGLLTAAPTPAIDRPDIV
ncbi:unnamed protein product, partial [Protopolystoma xenopodis]